MLVQEEAIAVKTYEFWRERSSGSVLAVVLEDGVVAGSCGPLDRADIDEDALPRLRYSAERAPWIEAHRDEFDLYAPLAQA